MELNDKGDQFWCKETNTVALATLDPSERNNKECKRRSASSKSIHDGFSLSI